MSYLVMWSNRSIGENHNRCDISSSYIKLIIAYNGIANQPILTSNDIKLSGKQLPFSLKNNSFTSLLTSSSDFRHSNSLNETLYETWRKIIFKSFFCLCLWIWTPKKTQEEKVEESSAWFQNVCFLRAKDCIDFRFSSFETFGSKIEKNRKKLNLQMESYRLDVTKWSEI